VLEKMRATQCATAFTDNGGAARGRADGAQHVLFEVKNEPEESKAPGDYYKVLAEVPGGQGVPSDQGRRLSADQIGPPPCCLTLRRGQDAAVRIPLTLPGQEFVSLGLRAFITLLRSIPCRTWTKPFAERAYHLWLNDGQARRPGRHLLAERTTRSAHRVGRSHRRARQSGGGQACPEAEASQLPEEQGQASVDPCRSRHAGRRARGDGGKLLIETCELKTCDLKTCQLIDLRAGVAEPPEASISIGATAGTASVALTETSAILKEYRTFPGVIERDDGLFALGWGGGSDPSRPP